MRTILFVGHRPDADQRPVSRFPDVLERRAFSAIRDAVARIARTHGAIRGMAGGASGGDIIFHEVCLSLGVPSTLYLALPEPAFIAASVAPSGDEWVRRFRRLTTMLPPAEQLHTSPPRAASDPALWEQNNAWLLRTGLAEGPDHLTLLALWDGEAGDGPGGTHALVAMARARGVDVEIINPRGLDTEHPP